MILQLISCKIELKRGEKILDNKFSIEYTSKMEKALRQIAKEDRKLFAEIVKKIEFFQKGEHEKLTLAPIKRNQAKYKISEIKIKSPESYRIFYVCIDEKNKRQIFPHIKAGVEFRPYKNFGLGLDVGYNYAKEFKAWSYKRDIGGFEGALAARFYFL